MAKDQFGIYRAQVLNVTDPLGQDRVQLMVAGSGVPVSGWALPCAPTKDVKVGDMAWVMFEGGDPSYPVFMGARPR